MNYNLNENNLKVISHKLEFILTIIWPISLVLTWILLLILSVKTGVFYNIPVEFLLNVDRINASDVHGFMQDPYYSIFQFFWIPFVYSIIYVYKFIPKILIHFVKIAAEQSEKLTPDVKIPPGLDNIINRFQNDVNNKWQWYGAFVFFIIAILIQVNIQIIRIEDINVMYWYDWRINKVIYIVRLAMLGIDMFFAFIISYRIIFSFIFIRRFLSFIQLTPRPFHTDGAGGLGIVGKVCLAFTVPMTVVGVTLATSFILHEEKIYYNLNIYVLLLYVIFVIFVFFYPLLTVHKSMAKNKEIWLNRISPEIHEALTQVEFMLKDVSNDSQLCFARLDYLKSYYKTVESMPVWPYDTNTLSRFFTSVLVPSIMIILELI